MGRRTWLAGVSAAALIGATAPAAVAEPDPSEDVVAELQTSIDNTPSGHMRPMWRVPANTGAQPDSIGIPGGYDPDALRAHLGLKGTGKGQTVAITVAFDVSAAVTKAVTSYTSWYGLKPPCSDTVTSGCFQLTFAAPNGTAPPTLDNISAYLSFELEANLDVELVHAVAPDAAITVVESHDDTLDSMMAAVDHAGSLHPAVISNSWGAAEFDGERAYDGHCSATAVPCAFASGDAGNPGGYPAADPAVLAVGGTTLDMGADGTVRSELGWSGSGGGISPFEPQPAYQSAADSRGTGRGVPDVSFDGDPNSGFAIYIVAEVPGIPLRAEGWRLIGGTSAGTPIWSAILAVTDQQRAAHGRPPLTADQIHAAVYGRAGKSMFDVSLGANGICGPICTAALGYDLVTGMGSPRSGIDSYLARH